MSLHSVLIGGWVLVAGLYAGSCLRNWYEVSKRERMRVAYLRRLGVETK